MGGVLVLVVGPSGAGKDTLLAGARGALLGDPRFVFARREITRPAEAGGEEHMPVSREGFAARRAAYALAWEAHGLGYGIPGGIRDQITRGRVVVANVSRTVIADAARQFPVLVVEVTASPEVLAARLAARARESTGEQVLRLARRAEVPACVALVRVVNDGPVGDGVAALVAAISRAGESLPPR